MRRGLLPPVMLILPRSGFLTVLSPGFRYLEYLSSLAALQLKTICKSHGARWGGGRAVRKGNKSWKGVKIAF